MIPQLPSGLELSLDQLDRDGALREAASRLPRGRFLAAAAGAAAVFGVSASPARAAVSKGDVAILNYALALEYLQAAFYTETEQVGKVAGQAARAVRVVGAVERAHVDAFRDLLGAKAIKQPTFDFRGVTEEQQAFLKTAVAFEDLAVAAYKGQAHLIKSDAVLAAAVAIHSVEARHAAWMRHLFGVRPAATPFDEAKPSGGDPEARQRDQVHRREAENGGQRRPEIHRLILFLLAGGAASLAVVLWVAVFGGRGGVEARPGPSAALAALPASALRVQQPVPLRKARDLAYWSPVLRSVSARASPAADAPQVALLDTRTAEQTPNIVLTLGRATDVRGRVWTRVRLPVLPNNTTGWVPRSALGGLSVVRTRLVVDLERLTATLYRAGKRIFSAGIGVGAPQWPTPRGEFYIRNRLVSYSSAFYGPVAFGTSARSEVLTDWPAGGFVGIHGTNRPELLPGRVSHGCIRMRNQDILRLARLLPVGTPLTIR